MAMPSWIVTLGLDSGAYVSGLNAAQQATKEFEQSISMLKYSGMTAIMSLYQTIPMLEGAFSKLKGTMQSAVGVYGDYQANLTTLNFLAGNVKVTTGELQMAMEQLTSDGLLSVTGAMNALKESMTLGASIDQATTALGALKNAAIAAGKAPDEALQAIIVSLRTGQSQRLDEYGITKNIDQMYKEQLKTLQNMVKNKALQKTADADMLKIVKNLGNIQELKVGQVSEELKLQLILKGVTEEALKNYTALGKLQAEATDAKAKGVILDQAGTKQSTIQSQLMLASWFRVKGAVKDFSAEMAKGPMSGAAKKEFVSNSPSLVAPAGTMGSEKELTEEAKKRKIIKKELGEIFNVGVAGAAGFTTLVDHLYVSMQKNPDAAKKLFAIDPKTPGALALVNKQFQELGVSMAQLEQASIAGLAQSAAGLLNVVLGQIKGQIIGINIKFGEQIADMFMPFVKMVQQAVTELNKLDGAFFRNLATATAVAAAFVGAAGSIMGTAMAITTLTNSMKFVLSMMTQLTGGAAALAFRLPLIGTGAKAAQSGLASLLEAQQTSKLKSTASEHITENRNESAKRIAAEAARTGAPVPTLERRRIQNEVREERAPVLAAAQKGVQADFAPRIAASKTEVTSATGALNLYRGGIAQAAGAIDGLGSKMKAFALIQAQVVAAAVWAPVSAGLGAVATAVATVVTRLRALQVAFAVTYATGGLAGVATAALAMVGAAATAAMVRFNALRLTIMATYAIGGVPALFAGFTAGLAALGPMIMGVLGGIPAIIATIGSALAALVAGGLGALVSGFAALLPVLGGALLVAGGVAIAFGALSAVIMVIAGAVKGVQMAFAQYNKELALSKTQAGPLTEVFYVMKTALDRIDDACARVRGAVQQFFNTLMGGNDGLKRFGAELVNIASIIVDKVARGIEIAIGVVTSLIVVFKQFANSGLGTSIGNGFRAAFSGVSSIIQGIGSTFYKMVMMVLGGVKTMATSIAASPLAPTFVQNMAKSGLAGAQAFTGAYNDFMSKSSANRGIELQKSADLRNKKTPEEPSMHVGGKTAGMNPNATDKGAKKGRAGAKTSPFHDQLAEWRAQLEDSLQHAKTVEEKITAHAVFVANVQKKGFEAGLLRESKTKAEKQKDREVIPDAQAAKEFAVLDVKSFYLQKKEDQLKHDDEISKREIELRAAVGEALAKLNDDAVAAELALITKAEAIANLESAATNRRIFIARDQVKLQEAKLAVVAKYGSSQGEAIRKALQNAEQELQIAELEHKGALIRKQTAAEDALIQPMRARGEENADRLDLVQKQAQMERTDNGQQSQGGMAVEEQALRDQIANLGDVLAGPQNDAKSQADVFNKYLGLYQQLTALKMKEIDLDARGLVTQQYRYELALKDAEAQKASSDDYLLRLRMEESTVKNRTKEQKAEARAAADKASAEENAAKVAFEKAKESVKFAETRQGPELIPGQRAKTIGTAMDIARTREQEYNNKKAAGEAARRNASGPDGKTIQMAESSKAGNDENKLKIANSLRAVEAAIGAQRRESLALEIQLLSAQQSRLTTMGDYVGAAALQQQKMNKAVEQEKTLRDEMAREVDPAKKQALAVKVTEAAGASGREKVQAAISGDKAWNYGVGAFGGQTQGRVAALAELQDRKSKNQATVNNRDADLEKERDFRKNIEFTKGEAEKSAAKAKDPAEKAMYEAAIASFITQMEESRAKEQEINTTADVAAGDLVNTDALIEEVQRSLFAAPLKLAMDIQANYDSFSGEMGKAVGGAFEQAIATSNWDNLQTNMAESMNKAGTNFVAQTIGGMLQQGVENSFKKSGDFLVQSGKLLGNELIKAGKTTQGDLDKAAGGLSAAFDLGMMAFTAGSILSSMGNNSGGKGEQKIKEGEEVFDQTSEVRGVVMGETSVGVGKLAELFDPIAIKLGLAVDALIEVANLLKGGAGGAGAQVASAAAGAGIASTAPGGTQVVDINLKVNGTLTVVADIPKMQREIDEAIRQTVMKVVKEELHNKTKG